MIKNLYFSLLFLLAGGYFCNAQPPGDNSNRLETIKIAYITKELNLSPEEAQKFWPAYNDYMEEIKQTGSKYQNNEVAYEEKVVDIKKKYQGNFQKILGSEARVNKMFTADRKYREMLRTELQNRQKQKQQGTEDNQQKNSKRNKKKPGIEN